MLKTFTPEKINQMTVKNRILRSATMENMADEEGFVTEEILKLYAALTAGGTGLIVTGACAVEKNGRVWNRQLAAWDDQHIQGLEQIAEVIHRYGKGCRCAVQLHHGGVSGYGYSYGAKGVSYALSDFTAEEIKRIIQAFGDAALRVKKAGFDAVAVHGAHGYLISQFMSPATNNRTDQWGGSLSNRTRFAVEVCYAIREKIGAEMPLLWKINCEDYLEGGQGINEYLEAATQLTKSGVDLIEISGGLKDQVKLRSRLKQQAGRGEAYFRHAVKPFKQAIGEKTLAVTGGIRSLQVMEELLAEGLDFLGICRPLICEPDLPAKFLEISQPHTSNCISCNQCLLGIAGGPVRCLAD
ncbi:2,4-dienoyl-CoA reductase [Desulfotomaculum arcticum]|uniref:2,4-dienoyl-CoA reductase n=1 Tax=Desulfotruncus arcticus DSM 17038 TaxID=1121424 RepID=A0A1I2NI74_9FIRM|nr:NADH:flavin oxidoreductase [Desulfotruncus arcticus]SFG01387.1 2,4-dienoyl-CoA reductase [Desulfotomaculum arcticum] [Desulfotruncus arcticus DSM 17038]